MTNNTIISFVVVLILIGGGWYFLSADKTAMVPNDGVEEASGARLTDAENPDVGGVTGDDADLSAQSGITSTEASVKEFAVSGNNFSFSLKEIKVKKGDTVRIVFTNQDGFHDWVIDEFNAKTNKIGAGKTETITFVADKVGTFEYYCSVGSHRANGMKGSLIVE